MPQITKLCLKDSAIHMKQSCLYLKSQSSIALKKEQIKNVQGSKKLGEFIISRFLKLKQQPKATL